MMRQVTSLILFIFFISCYSAKKSGTDNKKSRVPEYLVTGYYYLSTDSDTCQRLLSGTTRKYNLNSVPIITVSNFKNVTVDKNSVGSYYIRIDLDKSGGQKWSDATGKSIGDSLAIIIDNELVQVAWVNAQINAPVTAINKEGLTKLEVDKYLAEIKRKMKK